MPEKTNRIMDARSRNRPDLSRVDGSNCQTDRQTGCSTNDRSRDSAQPADHTEVAHGTPLLVRWQDDVCQGQDLRHHCRGSNTLKDTR